MNMEQAPGMNAELTLSSLQRCAPQGQALGRLPGLATWSEVEPPFWPQPSGGRWVSPLVSSRSWLPGGRTGTSWAMRCLPAGARTSILGLEGRGTLWGEIIVLGSGEGVCVLRSGMVCQSGSVFPEFLILQLHLVILTLYCCFFPPCFSSLSSPPLPSSLPSSLLLFPFLSYILSSGMCQGCPTISSFPGLLQTPRILSLSL